MHDCNHKDVFRFNGIKHRVGKHPGQLSLDILGQERIARWTLSNAVERGFNGLNKTPTQTRLSIFVVGNGTLVFPERLGM